jgi:cytochrome c oxidase subunit 4
LAGRADEKAHGEGGHREEDFVKREYVVVLAVWLALVALALLSCGSAYLPIGAWNTVASMSIAVVKAVLVALFFMRLARSGGSVRIYAVVGTWTLFLLLSIGGSDYLSRDTVHAPWQQNAAHR